MASKVSSTSSSNAVERTRTVTGHLGHLTPAEETALAEFKKLSADQRLYTPPGPGPDSTQKASHDDGTLLCVNASKVDAIQSSKSLLGVSSGPASSSCMMLSSNSVTPRPGAT